MTASADESMARLRAWEIEAIVAARHAGHRPASLIAARYDHRAQGDLVAVLTRIVRGEEQADLRERRLAAQGVAGHPELFDLATVEAARHLLGIAT